MFHRCCTGGKNEVIGAARKVSDAYRSMLMSINYMKTGGRQWICTHTSFSMVVNVVRWCFVCAWLCVSLCSLQDWVWPAGLTRWWRYTRPPRMTSCCVCSEGSCAPTRTEWASWWERWWTTSHGQFHNQTPNKPHQQSCGFLLCRLWNGRREMWFQGHHALWFRISLRKDTSQSWHSHCSPSVMIWPGDNAKAKKNNSVLFFFLFKAQYGPEHE